MFKHLLRLHRVLAYYLYILSVVIAILSELDTSFQEEEMIQMHFDTKATNY